MILSSGSSDLAAQSAKEEIALAAEAEAEAEEDEEAWPLDALL